MKGAFEKKAVQIVVCCEIDPKVPVAEKKISYCC